MSDASNRVEFELDQCIAKLDSIKILLIDAAVNQDPLYTARYLLQIKKYLEGLEFDAENFDETASNYYEDVMDKDLVNEISSINCEIGIMQGSAKKLSEALNKKKAMIWLKHTRQSLETLNELLSEKNK